MGEVEHSGTGKSREELTSPRPEGERGKGKKELPQAGEKQR